MNPCKYKHPYNITSAVSRVIISSYVVGLSISLAVFAKEIKDKDIAEALDLPPIKLHCSVLAEDSIKKAIEDWETKTNDRNNR